ncbi:hypothetical protein DM828_27835 [Pseudomonas umsongensis]|nr:hypothetical protein [Pseudomonas umsongensis]
MPIVGASLLAKAAVQSTSMLNVPDSSRAGSLPQVFGVVMLWRYADPPAGTARTLPYNCG